MQYNVMVVDDDEICLLMHTQVILNNRFHESPLCFNSAEKALAYLNDTAETNKPFVMFLDINMPVMNGWDLLDLMHQDDFREDIFVVIVSSSIDMRDKEKAASYTKVIDFFEKPFANYSLGPLQLKISGLSDSNCEKEL